MKLYTLLLSSAMLVGCVSSRPQYQEPSVSNAPRLTITTSASDRLNIAVVSYDGDEYLESHGRVITLLNSKAIGYDFASEKTIQVAPGRTFRFTVRIGNQVLSGNTITATTCITHTSFVPEEGGTYVAKHERVAGGCNTMIYREVAGSLSLEPTYVKHPACADPSLGFAGFPNACASNFQFK